MRRTLPTITSALVAFTTAAATADGDNSAFVEQIGSGNSMVILQAHDPAVTAQVSDNNQIGSAASPVYQEGANNVMTIRQGNHAGGGYDSVGGSAPVFQSGDGNDLNINQLAGNNVVTEVRQSGSGNIAAVFQHSGGIDTGGTTVDLLQQQGQGNSGRIEQTNASGSHASLIQGDAAATAINTTAEIYQLGGQNNLAMVSQTGEAGWTRITQTGWNSVAHSLQVGDQNQTDSVQHGDDQFADLMILGSQNYLRLEQEISGQTATIAFVGDRNRLIADQKVGTGNVIAVDIAGNDNGTSAFASGGAAESITQLTSVPDGQNRILQSGNGNALSVIAVNADNNSFGLQQNGDSNNITGVFATNGGASSTNDNDVAVFQGGSSNAVNFAVSGVGNSLGIAQ